MANPILSALPDGVLDKSEMREWFAKGFVLVKDDAAEVPMEDYSTTPYLAIYLGGSIFAYDAADTTTAHDGTTCLVSSDGRRYKVETQTQVKYKVDDKDTTAQPASPAVNDAYLLPAAPTGDDWSSNAKAIAIYSARGWLFYPPEDGDIVFVSDETRFYHFDGTDWVPGLGDLGIADNSIGTAQLKKKFGYVVEAETNTPPTLPGAGVAYIVGTSPTGDWSSNAADIAESDGSDWVFFTPQEGSRVWDKGTDRGKVFRSGAWENEAIEPGVISTHFADTTSLTSINSGDGWQQFAIISSLSISTTDNEWVIDCFIWFETTYALGSADTFQVGVFIDSESTPRDSKETPFDLDSSMDGWHGYGLLLKFTPPDTDPHDIKLKARSRGGFRFDLAEGELVKLQEIA